MLDAKKLDRAFSSIVKSHRPVNFVSWCAVKRKEEFWDLVVKEYNKSDESKSTGSGSSFTRKLKDD